MGLIGWELIQVGIYRVGIDSGGIDMVGIEWVGIDRVGIDRVGIDEQCKTYNRLFELNNKCVLLFLFTK